MLRHLIAGTEKYLYTVFYDTLVALLRVERGIF
jgi:hypothetical protein